MPYASNSDVRIRYEVEGTGPPVVLHPGFTQSLEDWVDAGYPAALGARYRVVLLDPRGQGQSDKPHDPTAYRRTQRVGDVLAVLDAAGIARAHVWGYSMGGSIAYALGVLAPDRVASLVVGGATPFRGNPRPTEGNSTLTALQQGMAGFLALWGIVDYPDAWVSAGERERFMANDTEALAACVVTSLTELDLSEASLAAIPVPALLYVGTDDDPEPVARAARLIPQATFVALEGFDHNLAFMRSDAVLAHAGAFLDRVAAG